MWEKLKSELFMIYLNFKYRSSKIKKHIWKHKSCVENKVFTVLMGEGQSLENDNSQLTVAALQLKMVLYDNPLKFADKMEELVCQASKEGARLVVFPEDNLSQLLGLLPGISDNDESHDDQNNNKKQANKADIDEILSEIEDDISISEILAFVGPLIKKVSLLIFAELSRKYNLYIMAGSGLFPDSSQYFDKGDMTEEKKNSNIRESRDVQESDSKNVFNIAYLFGPDGKLVGRQKKNHLLPLEDKWGLKSGQEISVFTTKIGKLAFPICMDATYFETFQIASNKGAEIVMIPIANPDADYNYWTALRGIWGRVQESPVYGIKSAMVGNFLGFELTGQAGIYAPIPLTANQDGIIAESDTHDCEEIIMAKLNLKLLKEYRENSKIEKNKEFEEKYFPDIYN